jgi:ATP-dependent protease ClpP protease subunit
MEDAPHGWNQIKDKLMNAGPGDLLEVHISSDGGVIREGIELYNIINSRFKNSQVYLNYGYSMGALTFLFFDDRTIYEHSDIMFHGWAGGFGGKSSDIEDQFNHFNTHLQKFNDGLLKPYFSKKEIRNIKNGREKWLTSYDILERGIATGIIKDGEYYTAEQYLERFKKNGKMKKSFKKKLKKLQKEEKEGKEVPQDG